MIVLRRLVDSSAGDRAETRLIPGSQKSEDLDVHPEILRQMEASI
jgi:hypothetical protein